MEVEQLCLQRPAECTSRCPPSALGGSADLVLFFGSTAAIADPDTFREIKSLYPKAVAVGCSTAGIICGTQVFDDGVSVTAIRFERTRVSLVRTEVSPGDSRGAGARLAAALDPAGLRYVLLLSDGLKVNGSELADAMRDSLPDSVIVTGGLAGDGDRFQRTVLCADAPAAEGIVTALGFYGERLRIGYGSLGGWDSFGPERLITRASGSVLHELDGQSALALYKQYLGPHADGLPATGLLFPLSVRTEGGGDGVVRTVLGIDEATQSMTFAGEMPIGAYARLMKANFDRLIEGAVGAARASTRLSGTTHPEFALLISCVGRKLILKQRTEEEVESVRDVLGAQAALAGFYSYGEICAGSPLRGCELHNQTMTITTFSEN